MAILYEDTDEQMQHSFDKYSFGAGFAIGAIIFTQIGRNMLQTALDIPEQELHQRIDEVRSAKGLSTIYK